MLDIFDDSTVPISLRAEGRRFLGKLRALLLGYPGPKQKSACLGGFRTKSGMSKCF